MDVYLPRKESVSMNPTNIRYQAAGHGPMRRSCVFLERDYCTKYWAAVETNA